MTPTWETIYLRNETLKQPWVTPFITLSYRQQNDALHLRVCDGFTRCAVQHVMHLNMTEERDGDDGAHVPTGADHQGNSQRIGALCPCLSFWVNTVHRPICPLLFRDRLVLSGTDAPCSDVWEKCWVSHVEHKQTKEIKWNGKHFCNTICTL